MPPSSGKDAAAGEGGKEGKGGVGVVSKMTSLVVALLFDPEWLPFVSKSLLMLELLLCTIIVMKVPCTFHTHSHTANPRIPCTHTTGAISFLIT